MTKLDTPHLATGLLAGIFACASILYLPAAEARIKCWTNDQGQKECGDRVPPKYSQGGHRTTDGRGFVIEEQGAAPTEEELEQRRQQELEMKQQERAAEKQAREDRVLLDTFPDEGDIIRSRDDKLITLDGQITLEKEKIKKLVTQLEGAEKRMQNYVDKEQEIPEVLTDGIAEYKRQLENAQEYIRQSMSNKEKIAAEYNAYLMRHREIRGFSAQGEQAASQQDGEQATSQQDPQQ